MTVSLGQPRFLLMLVFLPLPWLIMRALRRRRLRVASLLPFRLMKAHLGGPPPRPPLLMLLLQMLAVLLLSIGASRPALLLKTEAEPVVVVDNSVTGVRPSGRADELLSIPSDIDDRTDLPPEWGTVLSVLAHRVEESASGALIRTRLPAPNGLPEWIEWSTEGLTPVDVQAVVSLRREENRLLAGVEVLAEGPAEQVVLSDIESGREQNFDLPEKGYRLLEMRLEGDLLLDGRELSIRLDPPDSLPENDTAYVVISAPGFKVQGGRHRRLSAVLKALGWKRNTGIGFTVGSEDFDGPGIRVTQGGKKLLAPVRPEPGLGELVLGGTGLPGALPSAGIGSVAGKVVLRAGSQPVIKVNSANRLVNLGFNPDSIPWAGGPDFAVMMGSILEAMGYPRDGLRVVDIAGGAPSLTGALLPPGGIPEPMKRGFHEYRGYGNWAFNLFGLLEHPGPRRELLDALRDVHPTAQESRISLTWMVGLLVLGVLLIEAFVFTVRRR